MKWVVPQIIILLLFIQTAFAESYSYTDSSGQERFLVESSNWIALVPNRAMESAEIQKHFPQFSFQTSQLFHAGKPALLPIENLGIEDLNNLKFQISRTAWVDRMALAFSVSGKKRPVILDQGVMVKVNDSTVLASFESGKYKRFSANSNIYLITTRKAEESLSLAKKLAADKRIDWVFPDFRFPVELTTVPSDPWYEQQWYHHQSTDAHLHSQSAWDFTLGSIQTVVAVIDTGVDIDHPDFTPSRIKPGYDAENQISDPRPNENAYDAHGTCTAGLIAMRHDNDEGGAGVCPRCALLPIRFLDGSTNETQLSIGYRAIQWAVDNHADVLSNSWEIGWEYIDVVDMQPFYEAIEYALTEGRDGLGCSVLFSAGNSHSEIDPRAVANVSGVIAVGATDEFDEATDYENFGANMSVVAPGGSNNMMRPHVFTTDIRADVGFSQNGELYRYSELLGDYPSGYEEPDPTGNYTAWFGGTSAATPMVAGVAGLMLTVNPELRQEEIRSLLEATADLVGGLTEESTLPDPYYGHGRVNAGRAVAAAYCGLDGLRGSCCAVNDNCQSDPCKRPGEDALLGQCAVSCSKAAPCNQGESCVAYGNAGGICTPECTVHSDCPAPGVCVNSACLVSSCSTDTDCPDESHCATYKICIADPSTDGDVTDGDVTDGDVTDGDVADGDATDGDETEDGDEELDEDVVEFDFESDIPDNEIDEFPPDPDGDVEQDTDAQVIPDGDAEISEIDDTPSINVDVDPPIEDESGGGCASQDAGILPSFLLFCLVIIFLRRRSIYL